MENITKINIPIYSFTYLTFNLTQFNNNASLSRLSINKTSGALTINQILDYEDAPSQSFDVVAKDGGGQNAKSASVGVTVYINDENDNDPVFENLPQTVYVLENQPAFRIFTVKVFYRNPLHWKYFSVV